MKWVLNVLPIFNMVVGITCYVIRRYVLSLVHIKETKFGIVLERILPAWVEALFFFTAGLTIGSLITNSIAPVDSSSEYTQYLNYLVLLNLFFDFGFLVVAIMVVKGYKTIDDKLKRLLRLNQLEEIYLKREEDVIKRIKEITSGVSSGDIESVKRVIAKSNQPGILIQSNRLEVNFTNGIIGKGGSGMILKGTLGGTVVALKMIQEQMAGNGMEELEGELNMLCKFSLHPSVLTFHGVTFYECNKTDTIFDGIDVPILMTVTEFCLTDLDKHVFNNGPLSDTKSFVNMVTGINEGISYLHQEKVAHTDLKPNNIFLDVNMKPKIADFGLAVSIEEGNIKVSAQTGTVRYRPPEIISFSVPDTYDIRKWDIFSLSMIYYYMLAGAHPFVEFEDEEIIEQEIIHGTRPTLPVKVATMIRRLIQRMWTDNFDSRPTMEKVSEDLGRLDGHMDSFTEDFLRESKGSLVEMNTMNEKLI